MLNSIQWINTDHNDISKHLEMCALYTVSDKCLYSTLGILIQNNILLPNYKNRYEELLYKYTQVSIILQCVPFSKASIAILGTIFKYIIIFHKYILFRNIKYIRLTLETTKYINYMIIINEVDIILRKLIIKNLNVGLAKKLFFH